MYIYIYDIYDEIIVNYSKINYSYFFPYKFLFAESFKYVSSSYFVFSTVVSEQLAYCLFVFSAVQYLNMLLRNKYFHHGKLFLLRK